MTMKVERVYQLQSLLIQNDFNSDIDKEFFG